MKKRLLIISTAVIVVAIIGITTYLVLQNQDNRQRAFEDTGDETCSTPQNVTGVLVEYPGCNGAVCDLATASCSWDIELDASSYLVTVTELETGTIIKNSESIPDDTTSVTFPITQKRTYKCDVMAVNSCGQQSAISSDQLFCEADALLTSPTPTQQPSTTPQPTLPLSSTPAPTVIPTAVSTPIPTPTPLPTATPTPIPTATLTPTPTLGLIATSTPTPPISQPGSLVATIGIIGVTVLIIIGGIFLLVL